MSDWTKYYLNTATPKIKWYSCWRIASVVGLSTERRIRVHPGRIVLAVL